MSIKLDDLLVPGITLDMLADSESARCMDCGRYGRADEDIRRTVYYGNDWLCRECYQERCKHDEAPCESVI